MDSAFQEELDQPGGRSALVNYKQWGAIPGEYLTQEAHADAILDFATNQGNVNVFIADIDLSAKGV